MDWANERYVRLYTRDSTTWKILDWRARTVLLFLLRKVDRAGVLEVGRHGRRGAAATLELPLEIVEPGLDQLGSEEVVVERGDRLVMPNFLAAQEAVATDAERKRRSRERRRTESMAGPVTPGHACGHAVTTTRQGVTNSPDASQNVTNGSRNGTESHVGSRAVTPSLAEPILAEPIPLERSRSARRAPKRPIPDDWAPGDQHRTLAAELGVDLEREATAFRLHAETNDRRAVRWGAAFEAWLRKAPELGGARPRVATNGERYHAVRDRDAYPDPVREREEF